MRTRMIFGLMALLLGTAVSASAAEDIIDPNKNRTFGAKLVQCGICHGQQGMPRPADFPIIWGQQENYLLKQIRDYATGERKHEVMTWMTDKLSPAEQTSMAATFAKRKWPAGVASTPPPSPPSGIDACRTCHEAKFLGTPQAPRLAGQKFEYLVETMRQFAEGERKNPIMMQLMKPMSAVDRNAMARYLASL